jgi:hypothetical protein
MGSFTLLDEVCYGSFPIENFLRQSRRSRRPEADAKNRTEKFPRTTEISRFFEIFGYQKFTDPKWHGFGRATRQVRSSAAGLALRSHSCGSEPSQSGSFRVVRHNPDLRRTPGSRVTDRRNRRVGVDLVGFALRCTRGWNAKSFLSRSGGALAVTARRVGISSNGCATPMTKEYRIAECWVGGPRGHPTRGLGITNRQSFETVD